MVFRIDHWRVLPNRDRKGATMGLRPTKVDEDTDVAQRTLRAAFTLV